MYEQPLATFCCWDITLCFSWSNMEFWHFFWKDFLQGLKVKRYIHSGWHHGDIRIEYAQMKEVASKNDPGDYYGIKFPYTKVPGINARKWILWRLCGFGVSVWWCLWRMGGCIESLLIIFEHLFPWEGPILSSLRVFYWWGIFEKGPPFPWYSCWGIPSGFLLQRIGDIRLRKYIGAWGLRME